MGRTCSPMKTNASTFRPKTTVSHTARGGMRFAPACARARGGPRRWRADHRQDAGQPDPFREDPHAERGDELHDDCGRHVADSDHQPHEQPPERPVRPRGCRRPRAGRLARRTRIEKLVGRSPHPPQGGNLDGRRRGGVVEQALALEDGQKPLQQLQRPQHGDGRCRVRRRDDRAEAGSPRPTASPAPARASPPPPPAMVRTRPGLIAASPATGAQFSRRSRSDESSSCVEQHRRDEERQREVPGSMEDARRARHQRQAEHRQARERPATARRCASPPRRQQHRRENQADDDFEFLHGQRSCDSRATCSSGSGGGRDVASAHEARLGMASG